MEESVAANVTSRAYAEKVVSSVFFTFASTYINILGAIVREIGPYDALRGNRLIRDMGIPLRLSKVKRRIVCTMLVYNRQPLSRHRGLHDSLCLSLTLLGSSADHSS